jgi:hypothetical protein
MGINFVNYCDVCEKENVVVDECVMWEEDSYEPLSEIVCKDCFDKAQGDTVIILSNFNDEKDFGVIAVLLREYESEKRYENNYRRIDEISLANLNPLKYDIGDNVFEEYCDVDDGEGFIDHGKLNKIKCRLIKDGSYHFYFKD